MDIKEFVKETLTQISDGLKESNEYFETINKGYILDVDTDINFDIAVTAQEGDVKGIGGKLGVANVLSAGGKKETTSQNTNYSRVQFKIKVKFNIGVR